MKILVGYTGSQLSQRALTVAQKHARAMQAELHVFTSAGASDGAQVKNAKLESSLKEARMMCSACQIDCRTEMSENDLPAAEDLIRYANEQQVDEIVIGLSKRSQLGKLIFGSTSRQVLLEAPCPVLTVK